MGKLQQHRIENREPKKPQSHKSLIEEIAHSIKPIDSKADSQNKNTAKTGYIILRESGKSLNERLIAIFDMPKSVSHKIIKWNYLFNPTRFSLIREIDIMCNYLADFSQGYSSIDQLRSYKCYRRESLLFI